jgi:hypothetical protein
MLCRALYCLVMLLVLSGCVYIETTGRPPPPDVYYTPYPPPPPPVTNPAPDSTDPARRAPIPLNPPR